MNSEIWTIQGSRALDQERKQKFVLVGRTIADNQQIYGLQHIL